MDEMVDSAMEHTLSVVLGFTIYWVSFKALNSKTDYTVSLVAFATVCSVACTRLHSSFRFIIINDSKMITWSNKTVMAAFYLTGFRN